MSISYNPLTDEPYLRLPSPHSSIIITPYRPLNAADQSIMVQNMNDPLVVTWLIGPPFPYKPENAEFWVNMSLPQCEAILEEVKAQKQEQYVSGSPFRCIREIVEEDEQGIKRDVLIGGVDVVEYPFLEFAEGSQERAEGVRRNHALEVGSGKKVWGIRGMFSFYVFLLTSFSIFKVTLLILPRLAGSSLPRPRHHDVCREDHHPRVGDSAYERAPFQGFRLRRKQRQRQGL